MRKAFTLLELIVAILIGSILILTIAGTMRSAMSTWEAVQERVSRNYERRTVLDLVKRQSSSIFYKRDAGELQQSATRGVARRRGRPDPAVAASQNQQPTPVQGNNLGGFELPEGASFFRGGPQELNYLSTVSFLSDFPGQVGVRYYVVQGAPEEGDSLLDMPNSRTMDDMGEFFDMESVPEAMEGDLYLYLEEKNLFLSFVQQQTESLPDAPPITGNDDRPLGESDPLARQNDAAVLDTHRMQLIGPLRKFTIRYRAPMSFGQELAELDEDARWQDVWDVDVEGRYPTAIEFTLFYEQPGITDDLPTEELDGVRMVIPVYDASNMARIARSRRGL